MQRIIRRYSLTAVITAALGLLAVTASALILAVGYRNQLGELRHTIYLRCLQRDAYDRASQDARTAQATYYQRLIVNLHRNGTDDALTRDLIDSAHDAIDGLHKAVTVGAPQGCTAYR